MAIPGIDPVPAWLTDMGNPAVIAAITAALPFGAVAPILPKPANTAPPAITGTAQVGATLTATNGTWSGSPTFTRRWLADDVEIAGQTGTTYVPVAGDVGKVIKVEVTATNPGGSTVLASAPTAAVIAAA